MIDVSEYQGIVDWHKVHASGIRRAYIKLSEGVSHVDPKAKWNATRARRAGIRVGFYHFAHPSNSPLQEGRFFVNQLRGLLHDGDLPPCLDLEVNEGHSWIFLAHWKTHFFECVDPHAGCLSCFYSYLAFYDELKTFIRTDRPRWIAAYRQSQPVEAANWFAWQYSPVGNMKGIRGHVDLSHVLDPDIKLVKVS